MLGYTAIGSGFLLRNRINSRWEKDFSAQSSRPSLEMSTCEGSPSPLGGGQENHVSRLLAAALAILRRASAIASNFSHAPLFSRQYDSSVRSSITEASSRRSGYLIYFVDSLVVLEHVIDVLMNRFSPRSGL